RERALAAFDALGPNTRIPSGQRALITDYMLGQLPAKVADQTYERLSSAPADRAWARVIASEISSLAAEGLPEIPAGTARRSAEAAGDTVAREADAALAAAGAAAGAGAEADDDQPTKVRSTQRTRASGRGASRSRAPVSVADDDAEEDGGEDDERRIAPDYGMDAPRAELGGESSRRGGAVLLALAALIVVVIVVVLVATGGSKDKKPSTSAGTTPTTSTTSTTPTTPTTGTTTTQAHLVAQVNLTSPTPGASSRTAGVAQVIKQGATTGIVIVAQGIPANTSHDAYAVWLYNSPSDNAFLGFVSQRVKKDGKLQTAGQLPANAAHFKQLLVTVETQAKPKAPAKIVLQGSLRLS
ncbi:MAG: hypothetical protein ACJ762_11295, partial [Solirubrobacteraceae bacterium]